jgi:hypothetical protein
MLLWCYLLDISHRCDKRLISIPYFLGHEQNRKVKAPSIFFEKAFKFKLRASPGNEGLMNFF